MRIDDLNLASSTNSYANYDREKLHIHASCARSRDKTREKVSHKAKRRGEDEPDGVSVGKE